MVKILFSDLKFLPNPTKLPTFMSFPLPKYAPCSTFKPMPHDANIRLHKKRLKAFDALPRIGIVDLGSDFPIE
jgi:hypothetical protein